jgi:hypothetical protein
VKLIVAKLANGRWLLMLFALTIGPSVLAQQAPTGAPTDHTNPDRIRQQDMSKREYQLRNFGTEPKVEIDKRKVAALAKQIEEDFNRILLLHNKIVRAISSEQPLDYHFVSDATEEIKKRSHRLQATLSLEDVERRPNNIEKSVVPDHARMRDSLITLCKQIKSFVTNPVIETPGTVNAEQLGKARHDLEDIVRMSDQINKNAAKLDKLHN